MSVERGGRDRLRELLDAVLDEDNRTLDDMAGGAYTSTFHFSRQLTRGAGAVSYTHLTLPTIYSV